MKTAMNDAARRAKLMPQVGRSKHTMTKKDRAALVDYWLGSAEQD
jgi:hypothetical protein